MHWSLWLVAAVALFLVFRLGLKLGKHWPADDEDDAEGAPPPLANLGEAQKIYSIAANVQDDVAHPSDLLQERPIGLARLPVVP